MLIRNYGLFWRREHVFWGRQRVAGHLKGYRSGERGLVADFREQQGVYVLFDDSFKLIYVGQTGTGKQRLFERLRQHTTGRLSDRWSRFSWFGIRFVVSGGELSVEPKARNVPLEDALDHLEAVLIEAAEPPHNRQGGRFGAKVHQFLLWRDDDVGTH